MADDFSATNIVESFIGYNNREKEEKQKDRKLNQTIKLGIQQ